MQRYFIHYAKNELTDIIDITGEDVHHISRVMRMKQNDQIICVTKDGYSALCQIVQISADKVCCSILEWIENNSELPVKVILANGLPKGDKLELVIQKGTELGASKFIPFNAARSIVKLNEGKINKKLERWNKIAKEAAEQSHRTIIPEVTKPASLKDVISYAASADVKIVAYEEHAKKGETSNLFRALNSLQRGGSLFAVFGPEGGFTAEEIKQLSDNGFLLCGLGPRILRAETAPLYLLSAVSYHFELSR
ncbi:MAG: 16S rRNA (uracil(1498)-N(3))-methyltransferase [Bacillaceae bacterium]|uniref:16S rRNA (uracil(1498)-N(3))-methyltransferase n=1 Tax=Aeribacillus TaxID=1055323 RepID=UPI000E3940D6|nr:16S rRNA (uracil(1498)-N(3))-methyltransferase [Bacillaceae bacterium ZC4]REJ21444.1 MAG: 16S rRNA (uracil(1498)-N(3))-methyltransferase [Bacillaceae bacterium]